MCVCKYLNQRIRRAKGFQGVQNQRGEPKVFRRFQGGIEMENWPIMSYIHIHKKAEEFVEVMIIIEINSCQSKTI